MPTPATALKFPAGHPQGAECHSLFDPPLSVATIRQISDASLGKLSERLRNLFLAISEGESDAELYIASNWFIKLDRPARVFPSRPISESGMYFNRSHTQLSGAPLPGRNSMDTVLFAASCILSAISPSLWSPSRTKTVF